MASIKDLTNHVYGKLTVVKFHEKDKWGQAKWLCKCSCGNIRTVRGGDLKSKRVQSCGCLRISNALKQSENNRQVNQFVVMGETTLMYDNKGNVTYIDTEDISKLSLYTWFKHTNNYWVCYSPSLSLHRFLMNCPKDKVVDHINHNKNDHRKSQLRICTCMENNQNMPVRKYKRDHDLPVGITRTKSEKYKAYFRHKDLVFQRTFATLNEAIDYRNECKYKILGVI